MKNIKNFITETNESISKKRMLKEDLDTPERDLYRRIVRVLTDYEAGEEDYDYTEEMYETLVAVQGWMCEQGYDAWA